MPRTELSRERVLRAAVDLADRGGFASLTMRKLADELGVGAMSLYHYVPNKDDLVDGMIDVVFGEIEPPSTEVDWRTAMRRRATSTRVALNRHRWANGLMENRGSQGPAGLALREAILRCLREAGFSVEETLYAYNVQDSYLYGFALLEATIPFEDAESSKERAETTAAGVDDLKDAFPYLHEMVVGHVATVGFDFDRAFDFGLDLILGALEARRASNGA
jgi:AcrR family transcriptional regulator